MMTKKYHVELNSIQIDRSVHSMILSLEEFNSIDVARERERKKGKTYLAQSLWVDDSVREIIDRDVIAWHLDRIYPK